MSRSQRLGRRRHRPTGAVVVAGAVVGAIALAGCGAGQITQTDAQVSAVNGVNAVVGVIGVRDGYIEFGERVEGANIYPRGGAAPLKMSIVNSGIEPDRLVSASSPAAASVEISGDTEIPAGRVLLIEGEPEPSAEAPSGAARPTGSPAASPAPAEPSGEPNTPGDEIGSAGQEGGQTRAAEPTSAAPSTPRSGTGGAESGGAQGQIVLTGLTEDIRAGLTYPVVLNFERAGQITLAVPVGYPEEPREAERPE